MIKYLLAILPINALANSNKGSQSPLEMLPMLAIFIGLFYFMIIKPQNKQKKDQETMLKSLKKGDEVSTSGGIIGKIEKIEGNIIRLLIAKETAISIHETSVSKILPKGSFNIK